MTVRLLGLSTVAVVLAAGMAGAQDGYRSGFVRTVEQGVTLQRASEASAEAAVPNLPFLPGDRVWTDDVGRLEVQFADGSALRLDSRSKLDFISQDGARRSERIVLRLWSGSIYLHYRDDQRSPEFTIETPEGSFEPQEAGIYRLDVGPGEARVAVIEGEATVEADRRARVNDGQQVVIREGAIDRGPDRLEASLNDEFARWDGDLQEQMAYAGGRDQYLPEEVSPYAGDFAAYGSWDSTPEYGHVWYPQVEVGWQPYTRGYWAWTAFGWTWVPNERWGWATSHYGRWGHGNRGWYWIPGASWGPAWVSWSVGGDYVGWCPLGYGDRPVVVRGFRGGRFQRDRGRAVPRGGVLADNTAHTPWSYLRRTDMGQRDVARRRVDSAPIGAAQVRSAPAGHTRLSRDLRFVDRAEAAGGRGPGSGAHAVPRNVRTRPTMGDTVEELRGDNMTNIPHPTPRRHRERDPAEEGRDDATATRTRDSGASNAPRRPYYEDGSAAPRRQGDATGASSDGEGARVRGGGSDRSRETVRPLFGPLSRPRSDDGASRDGSRDGATRERSRDGATRDDASRERERPAREGWGRSRSDDEGSRARPRGESTERERSRGDSGRDRESARPAPRPEPRPERHDSDGGGRGRSSGASSGDSRRSAPPPSAPSGGDHARPRDRERPH